MQMHTAFEWDEKKAALNALSHQGVRFEDAREVLEQQDGDVFLIERYDDEHSSKEDRFFTFGSHPLDRKIVLRISWMERESSEGSVTRIFSARIATPKQREKYEEEIRKRLRGEQPW